MNVGVGLGGQDTAEKVYLHRNLSLRLVAVEVREDEVGESLCKFHNCYGRTLPFSFGQNRRFRPPGWQ